MNKKRIYFILIMGFIFILFIYEYCPIFEDIGYGLGFHLCGHGVVEDGVDGAVDVRARLFKHWRLFISINLYVRI